MFQKYTLLILIIIFSAVGCSSKKNFINTINSGIPWFDTNGNIVSAHGAGIIKDKDTYYLFGEYKSDTSNVFNGFSCYSSKDLYQWTFESIALPVQHAERLGSNSVGERPKVMKCPKTGEFIMYMHSDNAAYKDQAVGYATSNTINGEYTFKGPILFDGKPIKKWDMGVFQDDDGTGYIITHSGNLYKLSDDYKSVTQQIVENMTPYCESPIIFKKDGVYFWLGSNLTSWERNDNYYFTATNLKGPWKSHGNFAPKDSLTWNSQCTFVLPIQGSKNTTYLYMGDRWAFPRQKSAATYVWQPLFVTNDSIYLPNYKQSWEINTSTGVWNEKKLKGNIIENTNTNQITYSSEWESTTFLSSISETKSNIPNASFSVNFKGSQIGVYGVSGPDRGYAKIEIHDSFGKKLQSNIIEMYCKYPEVSLKYLSPILKKSKYKLTVTVLGDHGNWYKKDGTKFGSTDNYISLDKIIVIE